MTTASAAGDLASRPNQNSRATAQRSLGPLRTRFPLWPPMTSGTPGEGDEVIDYPLEIEFDLDAALIRAMLSETVLASGLERWSPMLPPLAPGLAMGEGGTPLVASNEINRWAGADRILIKDESRNPTWSHKDRLNLRTVSAAVLSGAPGVAVASSGNHGASAAAYAARAGLPWY